MPRLATLRAIRLIHTLIWAFFASCIVAIPVAAWRGEHRLALSLVAVVLLAWLLFRETR